MLGYYPTLIIGIVLEIILAAFIFSFAYDLIFEDNDEEDK